MAENEWKFKNRLGNVITTSNPSVANDYRLREGFEELTPKAQSRPQAGEPQQPKS